MPSPKRNEPAPCLECTNSLADAASEDLARVAEAQLRLLKKLAQYTAEALRGEMKPSQSIPPLDGAPPP